MDMRKVIAQVAGQVYGTVIPFSGPVMEGLISELLGVQDEQLIAMSRLDARVQRMADTPFHAGRIHLEDAAVPGRTPAQVQRSLEQAADRFRDAVAAHDPQSPARAEARLQLAITCALLRDQPAARHHAVLAYREARMAAWVMTNDRSNDQRPRRATRPSPEAIGAWYRDLEWAAARIGDPESGAAPPGHPGGGAARSWPDETPVFWRTGVPMDFWFIAYAQQDQEGDPVSQFAGRTLEQVIDEPRGPLPSPFQRQIEREHRMRYFTGLED